MAYADSGFTFEHGDKPLLHHLVTNAFRTEFFQKLDDGFEPFLNRTVADYERDLGRLDTSKPAEADRAAVRTLAFIREFLLYVKFTDGLAFDLLQAWKKYENLVYLTRDTYRDHFMHQFHVFLLGCMFLERAYGAVTLHGRTSTAAPLSRHRFLRRWFLAAIFHDVGYPAETLADLKRTLHEGFFNKIPNFSVDDIKMKTFDEDRTLPRILESISIVHLFSEFIGHDVILHPYHRDEPSFSVSLPGTGSQTAGGAKMGPAVLHATAIAELNALFLDEVRQTCDHGVCAAVFFLKTALIDLREMVKDPLETNTCWREPLTDLIEDLFIAAGAIAGHNLRSHTYRAFTIDFSSRPTAALLNFCDDFQEWDRRPNDPDWSLRQCSLRQVSLNEGRLRIDFDLKGDPITDEIVRKNQRSLLDTLDHLFEMNLSDEFSVFCEAVTISGFRCGKLFHAQIADPRDTPHLAGRYTTSRIEPDGTPATCHNGVWDRCVRCSYLGEQAARGRI
jgi:hypothetical protein